MVAAAPPPWSSPPSHSLEGQRRDVQLVPAGLHGEAGPRLHGRVPTPPPRSPKPCWWRDRTGPARGGRGDSAPGGRGEGRAAGGGGGLSPPRGGPPSPAPARRPCPAAAAIGVRAGAAGVTPSWEGASGPHGGTGEAVAASPIASQLPRRAPPPGPGAVPALGVSGTHDPSRSLPDPPTPALAPPGGGSRPLCAHSGPGHASRPVPRGSPGREIPSPPRIQIRLWPHPPFLGEARPTRPRRRGRLWLWPPSIAGWTQSGPPQVAEARQPVGNLYSGPARRAGLCPPWFGLIHCPPPRPQPGQRLLSGQCSRPSPCRGHRLSPQLR